jgi:type VI secretion system VasD/TssJ family lipoprotein
MSKVSWPTIRLALPLYVLLAGCSSLNSMMGGNTEKQALAGVQWNYGNAALRVDVDTDAALNSYDGEAHSVVLALVQAADPGAFYQFLDTPDLVAKVLQGSRPPSTLLQVTRYALEPARKAQIRLDRAQGARYLGIVAAFYDVPVAKGAKLFNLPVAMDSSGLVVRNYSATPAAAVLSLKLGPADIVEAGIKAVPAEEPGKGEEVRPNVRGAVKLTDLSEP